MILAIVKCEKQQYRNFDWFIALRSGTCRLLAKNMKSGFINGMGSGLDRLLDQGFKSLFMETYFLH